MDQEAVRRWREERPGRDLGQRSICTAPSVSLEFDPSGWVYGCCANQLYPLGRIGQERLRDIWSGPRVQVLRDALEQWDLSVGCGACRWHFEHGRMDPDAAVYDLYSPLGPEPAHPLTMTFALSNRCNLACTMCTPELSSTLRHRAGLAPLSSPYDDGFFADLEPFLPGLRYAKFLGGEPFLIPEHHRIWDLMARVGGPPRMQVTTNGTIWNDRVEWLLDTFAMDVTVSVDGATASTYESIRVGSNFGRVIENIGRFAAHARAEGTEFRLCYCLMDRNAHELVPFLRWADELDAPVSINVVSDIGMALHDLPVEQLESVREGWLREVTHPFGRNAEVWETQLTELDAVIAERRAGIPPAPRQADRADPAVLVGPSQPRDVPQDARATARNADRLDAWSEGGPVGWIRVDTSGTVVEVRTPLERLGIDSGLLGSKVAALLTIIEDADGRRAHLLSVDDREDGSTVRTIVLSRNRPVRGTPGSVVRFELMADRDGCTILVAEDRIYDAAAVAAADGS